MWEWEKKKPFSLLWKIGLEESQKNKIWLIHHLGGKIGKIGSEYLHYLHSIGKYWKIFLIFRIKLVVSVRTFVSPKKNSLRIKEKKTNHLIQIRTISRIKKIVFKRNRKKPFNYHTLLVLIKLLKVLSLL